MNNLLDRGLIKATGRLDVPGRPMLYGTTLDFLRCFGLNDLDSLPKTSDELMEVFERAKSQEEAMIEEAEEEIANGEQLTLDIEDAMDTSTDEKSEEESVANDELAEPTEEVEESIDFDEPSADDDIHED